MNGVSVCFQNLPRSGRQYWKGPAVTHHVTSECVTKPHGAPLPFWSAVIIPVRLVASI